MSGTCVVDARELCVVRNVKNSRRHEINASLLAGGEVATLDLEYLELK